MISESVLLGIIGIVVPSIAAITGFYTVWQLRHNRRNEADEIRARKDETVAKKDETVERVQNLKWEREEALFKRMGQLETDRRDLSDRLEAVENELHQTRLRYENDLAAERKRREEALKIAKQVQESLEAELQQLRGDVARLTKENDEFKAKIKQLASRVETGELGSGGHKRK